MRLLKYLFLCSFLWHSCPLLAQQSLIGFSPELNIHFGKVIKHTPKLLFDVPNNSVLISCNLKYQTYGKKDWHALQNYPQMGLALSFQDFGNKSSLGHAFGFLPNLSLYFFRRPKISAHFMVGTGFGILSKHYHQIDNPLNNAIGSRLNNMTALGFGLAWNYHPFWKLNLGVNLIHYSNGASSLPNFGLNIPTVNLGLQYTPGLEFPKDYQPSSLDKSDLENKFGMSIHFDLAFKEQISAGGPRYPVYIASVAGMYRLNPVNRVLLGAEYEFNKAVYEFALHVYQFSSPKETRRRASRIMLFAADEFLFGDWAIQLQTGLYVSKNSFLRNSLLYNKLSVRYYLPAFGRPSTQFYAGVYLKAHIVTAEYIAFGFGAAF